MSDFEAVLERLLGDPGFQSALAEDPGRALTGYSLSDEERELLHAQLVPGGGEERTVEIRTTKSSMMGLFGGVAAGMGVGVASAASAASAGGPGGGFESVGTRPADESFGPAPAAVSGTESFGPALTGTESVGTALPEATEAVGRATVPAENYAPRIDVDGDGRWDRYTSEEYADGGVAIMADMDGDGRVDFVGRDLNRDGLVDSAEYDTNFDGTFDQRLTDDNRDGWLDRAERIEPN